MADTNYKEQELRQAKNQMETVGTISEFDITIKECKKDANIDGEDKKIKSAMIYGTIAIDVDGETISHSLSALDLGKHTKRGDEKKQFKGIMSALGYEYAFDKGADRVVYARSDKHTQIVPRGDSKITFKYLNGDTEEAKVKGKTQEADRVVIKGHIGNNESLNKDKSDLAFYPALYVTSISTSNVPIEDMSAFTVEGLIKDIYDELNSMGSATGREVVNLVTPNFFGVDEFKFTVPKEWEVTNEDGSVDTLSKDDFVGFFKKYDTIEARGRNIMFGFGTPAKKTSSNSFGAKSEITSGFKNLEWSIRGGDKLNGTADAYDKDLIGKAYNEYKITLDARYKKRLEDYNESQKSKGGSSNSGLPKKNGLGQKPQTTNDPFANDSVDSSECPF